MNYLHKIRVRYGECDQMGFVHHSVFALYFEEARTEFMRSLGIPYSDLEKEGIIMPVKAMHFNFIKAALYDDLLTVKVKLEAIPLIRCKFTYVTLNEEGILLNTGSTELIFVNKEFFKPTPLPEKWLDLMKHNLEK